MSWLWILDKNKNTLKNAKKQQPTKNQKHTKYQNVT